MMNTYEQTAIIIGASVHGLSAAKHIASLFKEVIVVEQQATHCLSTRESHYLQELCYLENVRVVFDAGLCSYLMNAASDVSGVMIQRDNDRFEAISASVVIDAGDDHCFTPYWLHCSGFGEVPYFEQQVVISVPMTQSVTLRSYLYHQMLSLPCGLFVIGDALSNFALLSGQGEQLATMQAMLLKQALSKKQDKQQFQKTLTRIESIMIREYMNMAKNRMGVEHHLETRRDFTEV